MITVDQLQRLRSYPTSSWALWNDDGADSVQFFEDNVGRLRNDVVFVGLNRSGVPRDWTNNFQNFHKPGHQGDRALKRLIQGQNLTRILGGYMTDLCDGFETNSGKVSVDIDSSGRHLEEQLEILRSGRVDTSCASERRCSTVL